MSSVIKKSLAFIRTLFGNTANTDVAPFVISVCRLADLHAFLAAGMDEGEGVVDGVNIHHDTHVSDITSGVGTGEEYQIAGLHFLTGDGDVAGVLVA